ncbi:hypothetical protein CTO_0165 [Chlamydia trachomatis A2497]|uniref:Uncharacterized protein n=1 Tax=Chlamydia trachomatis serovar A (strain A2497) TaxID=580047 RepID=G4NNY8_CHLT4|nr:hypothetical protein CTO_0165 [Chlamydia trachomatis A2497]
MNKKGRERDRDYLELHLAEKKVFSKQKKTPSP